MNKGQKMRVFSGIYAYNYHIVPQTAGAAEGKPKRMTVMGEAGWIDFRTRVRFPPGPLVKTPDAAKAADRRLFLFSEKDLYFLVL